MVENVLGAFMDADRVNHEKEWHNKTFGTDNRDKVRKYRSVLVPVDNKWEGIILNHVNETTLLLDYGCGDGSRILNMCKRINRGIGIDISDARIEQAKSLAIRKNATNVDFLIMDAMNTTFENETFDVIRGGGILHHIDLKDGLNEIKRILKPTGVAIFYEPLGTNIFFNLYRKMTPEVRTIDEQPLRIKDIKLIKSFFSKAEISYYCFLPLLAVPFKNFNIFDKLLKILYFFDKILLNKYSLFKWLAWQCIIVLKK
jgi:SAM-dependent methyltransferase